MAISPNLTYTITHYKPSLSGAVEENIPLSGTVRKSFASGYNKIYVLFKSDISLSRYETRVTKADSEYGVGIGTLVYSLSGAIAANTNHAYEITISSEGFTEGDTTYRISMYAQNAADRTWDSTSFLVTTQGLYVADSSGNLLEVYEQGDINTILSNRAKNK